VPANDDDPSLRIDDSDGRSCPATPWRGIFGKRN
jgi:hypothetical protein